MADQVLAKIYLAKEFEGELLLMGCLEHLAAENVPLDAAQRVQFNQCFLPLLGPLDRVGEKLIKMRGLFYQIADESLFFAEIQKEMDVMVERYYALKAWAATQI